MSVAQNFKNLLKSLHDFTPSLAIQKDLAFILSKPSFFDGIEAKDEAEIKKLAEICGFILKIFRRKGYSFNSSDLDVLATKKAQLALVIVEYVHPFIGLTQQICENMFQEIESRANLFEIYKKMSGEKHQYIAARNRIAQTPIYRRDPSLKNREILELDHIKNGIENLTEKIFSLLGSEKNPSRLQNLKLILEWMTQFLQNSSSTAFSSSDEDLKKMIADEQSLAELWHHRRWRINLGLMQLSFIPIVTNASLILGFVALTQLIPIWMTSVSFGVAILGLVLPLVNLLSYRWFTNSSLFEAACDHLFNGPVNLAKELQFFLDLKLKTQASSSLANQGLFSLESKTHNGNLMTSSFKY